MNKIIVLVLVLTLLFCGCGGEKQQSYNDPYNPQAAIEYSYKYIEERNPDYANFDSNCTNYISQVLIAGGKQPDESIPPEENVRITYHNKPDRWFSCFIETCPERWREFSVSTSFCRVDSFVKYWTEVRGMKLSDYVNSMDGMLKLYENASEGDVILLYDNKGNIAHLCLLAVKNENQLLVNANTVDYCEHNILLISAEAYPKIGLLEIA